MSLDMTAKSLFYGLALVLKSLGLVFRGFEYVR